MKNWKSNLQHFVAFIWIEVIFVVVLFRELPETNFISLLWVLHASYWCVILLFGWIREFAHRVRQKFLCTYIPLLYHVAVHIFASYIALEKFWHHEEHNIYWLISWWLLLWGLIWLWEWRLHRSIHCETHHKSAHTHCHDWECEKHH